MPERVPLETGYFAMPDAEHPRPRLIGSYSPTARLHFYPRRRRCPVSLGPVEDRFLSTEGVLHSWTWIATLRYGAVIAGAEPHGIGQVVLPEGVRVQTRLAGQMGDWEIGMPMVTELLPVDTDSDGNERCTYCFTPKVTGA